MPVSRRTTEAMAADIAATYATAEVRLLRLIARHLKAGATAPQWAEAKLAELQMFRRNAEAIARRAHAQASGQIAGVTEAAYLRGTAAAEGELEHLGRAAAKPPRHAERQVRALVAAQQATLAGIPQRVVRQAADVYQQAVARAVAGTLTGSATRLQDAQAALDDLARHGLSGFTDRAGRRWEMATYTEMATRTTTAQAAVLGHLDRLEDAGLPLVMVSDSPRECAVCRPWEGKVLSRGPVPTVLPNALTGALERVEVDGTVDQALAAGLMHPNCTHSLSAYVPGATVRPSGTENAEGYAERQELRHLERKTREWKRREAVALTPEAERAAKAKVAEWQGRIRDHTDATGLLRQRQREQIGRAR